MKHLKSQSGLTLIEALVAITVLSVGVLGPLTIAARGIGDGLFARNQLAANYLAQEGLEAVINRRYAKYHEAQVFSLPSGQTIFNTDPQITDCVAATGNGKYCSVDPEASTVAANCDDAKSENCRLLFDIGRTGSYLYRPVGAREGDQTAGPEFVRLVQMEYPAGDQNKLKVTVTINWQNKDVPRTLSLVDYLYGL